MLAAQFPVDVFQTGSGTSQNMNNEARGRVRPLDYPCTRTTM
jgi:hypothetical protein